MPVQLAVNDQLLNGQTQSVATSQTNKVVSNVFQITYPDSSSFLWQIDATVTGILATAKLQQSVLPGSGFADVDGTNAKIALSATGVFTLAMSPLNSLFAAKMPLMKYLRVVVTTTGTDTVVVNHVYVQTAIDQ